MRNGLVSNYKGGEIWTNSHLKLEKSMEDLQNLDTAVTSVPQRDHVDGVVIVTEESNAGGQEPAHTGRSKALKKPRWLSR